MGVASPTADVCDVCWGSGDAHRHGENLRAAQAKRHAWDEALAIGYLACRLGTSSTMMRKRLCELAALCEGQARRHKMPAGTDRFWWKQSWNALADLFRKMGAGG